jgi:predicted GNAT family acetyltransferase
LKYLEEHSSGGRLAPMLWDCSFLALDGETPVAAVFTSNENSHPLFHEVFTHPDSRGHGLATALLRRAMSALTAQGFGHVRLRVAVANETARQLYERLGFVPA